jgi:glycosyltransferase involved in cell wall biosynthesis
VRTVQVPRRFVRQSWGGTETVILETSRRLLARGHSTEIACANALAQANAEVIGGVQVTRFPYFYPYWGLSLEAKRQLDHKGGNLFSFALWRWLRQVPNLDLIHLHTGKRLGGIVRHVAARRRIPYVVSLHGGVLDVPGAEAQSWIEPTHGTLEWGKLLGLWVGSRRVLTDAAAVICVGQEECRRVQQAYPDTPVVHLPNGVDPARFAQGDGPRFRHLHGIPADAWVMLCVGRLDPQKNQAFAVELLRELRASDPRAHLVLVGHVTNEPYAERLRAGLRETGLEPWVTLIPGLDAHGQELVDAYHAADVFLLPSVHEPFGIVILEAWAAGRAVVASRVGGVPSFVDDGDTGLLCPSGDAPAFLAALSALRGNPERAAALAAAGRRQVSQLYSWDVVTDRLVHIYEEAVRGYPVR